MNKLEKPEKKIPQDTESEMMHFGYGFRNKAIEEYEAYHKQEIENVEADLKRWRESSYEADRRRLRVIDENTELQAKLDKAEVELADLRCIGNVQKRLDNLPSEDEIARVISHWRDGELLRNTEDYEFKLLAKAIYTRIKGEK